MPTFEEILAKASPSTGSVHLLVGGELVGEIRELERQLTNAKPPTSLGERNPATVIAEQIAALQERMRASEVEFKLQAMGGRAWDALKVLQPQREKEEDLEAYAGRFFDWSTIMVSRTCVDPVMTPEQVAQLVDRMPGSSWDELSNACWALNAGKVSVPFSAAVSALTSGSDETSRRPSSSASPPPGSAARNGRRAPRTSTTKPAV